MTLAAADKPSRHITEPEVSTKLRSRLDEGLRVEVMTITPDLATKWLKRNRINRPIIRRHVSRYVAAMQSGAWDDVNGTTIIFSDANELLDGQHRLMAIVESQCSIQSLVVFGVLDHKRATIDTGAMRSLADFVGMGGEKNARNLASTLTVLHAYEEGALLRYPRGGMPFVNYVAGQRFLEAHPGIQDSVRQAKLCPALMSLSQVGALHYLFMQKDATLAEVYISTLRDGHLRDPYEVFLWLRERLLRDKTTAVKRHLLEAFVCSVKAWNAARRGRTIKQFKWLEEEAIPAIL